MEEIENKIELLNVKIFAIKVQVNSNYGSFPTKLLNELVEERSNLKKQLKIAYKQQERIKKLQKINVLYSSGKTFQRI